MARGQRSGKERPYRGNNRDYSGEALAAIQSLRLLASAMLLLTVPPIDLRSPRSPLSEVTVPGPSTSNPSRGSRNGSQRLGDREEQRVRRRVHMVGAYTTWSQGSDDD